MRWETNTAAMMTTAVVIAGRLGVRDEPAAWARTWCSVPRNARTLSAQRVCSLGVSRTFHRGPYIER
jgi:hypothetical protein